MAEPNPYIEAANRGKSAAMGARLNGTVSPDDIERGNKYGVTSIFARDNADQLSDERDKYWKSVENASPEFLEYISANPVEDVEEMSFFETIGRQWDAGFADSEYRDLFLRRRHGIQKDMAGLLFESNTDWSEEDEEKFQELKRIRHLPKGYDIGFNVWEWFLPEAARQAGIMATFTQEAGRGGAVGGTIGGAIGAASPDPYTTAMGATAGAKAGSTMFMMRESATLEYAFAFEEFMDDPEIDEETAQQAALVVGAINGLLEVTFGVERLIPRSLMALAHRNSVKSMLKSPTMRAVIKEVGGMLGKTMLTEGGQEMTQETTQVIAGAFAKGKDSPYEFMLELQENMGRIIQAGAVGGAVGLGYGPVFAGPEVVVKTRQVAEAKRMQKNFIAMADAVKQSSTLSGSESARAALAPEGEVYIPHDAWDVYWQEAGVDPREMAEEVIGNAEAYDQAAAAGSDIVIPGKRYAAKLLTTEHSAALTEDMRLSPDHMTVRESKAWIRENVIDIEEDPVLEELKSRLEAAGYSAEDAESNASQMADTLNTLAEKRGLGESAEDLVGLPTVTREGLEIDEGAILNQDLSSTPSGARIEQDFSGVTLKEDVELEETGEVMKVETKPEDVQRNWDQTVKRRSVTAELLNCL